jgi:hypothetical protein
LSHSTPTTPVSYRREQLTSLVFEDEDDFIVDRVDSPPLRSSNPIPLNTPFQASESKDVTIPIAKPQVKAHQVKKAIAKQILKIPVKTEEKILTATKSLESKDRERSKSWPVLSEA